MVIFNSYVKIPIVMIKSSLFLFKSRPVSSDSSAAVELLQLDLLVGIQQLLHISLRCSL